MTITISKPVSKHQSPPSASERCDSCHTRTDSSALCDRCADAFVERGPAWSRSSRPVTDVPLVALLRRLW